MTSPVVGYVRVAVPVPLHQLFTYSVPDGAVPDGARLGPGCRVRVPFGARRLVGIVLDQPAAAPPSGVAPARIRPLEAVLDDVPAVGPELLELCGWLAAYYHVPPGQAYALPLPPRMTGGRRGQVREHAFREELVARWLREADGRPLGARMDAALTWLRAAGEASAREVREGTGAGRDVLDRLARRGLIALDRRTVLRDPFARLEREPDHACEPTAEQVEVIEGVRAAFGAFRGFLLHGVTGSGKTEVYLALIADVIAAGRAAIVLVPEIALTPQLVGRFRARLGDRIAVLHSGLDPAARHEQWVRIASGELPVVIGARSALFAPAPRLGLLVVDEEHDGSFKQDTSPHYHARDLALVRGRIAACPVLLGSATPSVETWANVEAGKLARLRMASRVQERPLPRVDIVDLRTAPTVGEDRILSRILVEALQETRERGEQSILLLNRRGFAAFVLCRMCGQTLSCPDCSVSHTWHRRRERLVCHYCDRVEARPAVCPACGDDALEEIGFGTERVEQLLGELLPDARVARMDRDTTRGHALGTLISAFRRRELDVLVGTQMVAKGHDFPSVTLVGVLLAEQGLRLPDFRAAERTFHLLTQIAGRAGRGELPGRVLVQTYAPTHHALVLARDHDTESFLDTELAGRRHRGFPPAGHLALFRLAGDDRAQTSILAGRVREHIAAACRRLGPAASRVWLGDVQPALIERVKGRWRFQVLLNAPTRPLRRRLLDAVTAGLDADKPPRAVQIALDVDPYSFF